VGSSFSESLMNVTRCNKQLETSVWLWSVDCKCADGCVSAFVRTLGR